MKLLAAGKFFGDITLLVKRKRKYVHTGKNSRGGWRNRGTDKSMGKEMNRENGGEMRFDFLQY